MEINFFYEEINTFDLNSKAKTWIEETIQNENKETGEINVIFCSDEHLLKMNVEHLGHDFYTDIITFDYSENDIVSGDLFISKDRVEDNANQFKEPFEKEIHRVIIHGVLHLLGYNDKTEEEQKKMREKENFYLDKLI